MRGYLIAIALLLSSASFSQTVFDVARSGDIQALGQMIKLNPDTVNSQNASGHTPLILAVYNHQFETADLLIESGADVNFSFSQGAAIHGAAFKGYLDMVKLLAENDAELDKPDGNGTTPLIYATLFGHTEVAEYLLAHGADPGYEDATGNSAMKYAQSLNNEKLLTLYKSSIE